MTRKFRVIHVFFLLSIIACKPSPDVQNLSLQRDVADSIQALGGNSSFNVFDLHLTESEKTCLSALDVTLTDELNTYGKVDQLESEISNFLIKIGNKESSSVDASKLISKLVQDLLAGSGKKYAWVALRSSIPNSDFDIPRWHIDGNFYDGSDKQYKIVMVLKGPQTLFFNLPEEMKDWFINAAQSKIIYNHDGSINKAETLQANGSRNLVADTLKSLGGDRVVSAKFGQGAAFIVGSHDAAVHSEPPINAPRLFISIVPGNEEQIQSLNTRWNSEKTAQ